MAVFAGAILPRYGRTVTVVRRDGSKGQGLAMVQALRDKSEEQGVFSPLGRGRGDRFLYLGSPLLALAAGERVVADGMVYTVRQAQLVTVGGEASHWWGVLSVRGEE